MSLPPSDFARGRPPMIRHIWMVLLWLTCCMSLVSQQPTREGPPAAGQADEKAETLRIVTDVRDAFLKRLRTSGLTCQLAPPTILVEDVPSFGQYVDGRNVLRTSSWTVLRPEERGLFFRLAGPDATEAAAREFFGTAVHHWIMVHELGHWWQACQNVSGKLSHYQVEFGANRISLAYWREVDPSVTDRMMRAFRQVLEHAPNPVPPGEDVEVYFNKNYQQLGPSPAYPWFQARMSVTAFEETPRPSFVEVVFSTGR